MGRLRSGLVRHEPHGCRRLQQQRDPLVGGLLVLDADPQPDVRQEPLGVAAPADVVEPSRRFIRLIEPAGNGPRPRKRPQGSRVSCSHSPTRAMVNADTNYGHFCTYRLRVFFRIPGSLRKPSLPWNMAPGSLAASAARDTPQERRQARQEEKSRLAIAPRSASWARRRGRSGFA